MYNDVGSNYKFYKVKLKASALWFYNHQIPMGDREVKQNVIIEFAVLIAGLILKQMQCNFKYY